jgi:26S proteasome regulatory subunit N1
VRAYGLFLLSGLRIILICFLAALAGLLIIAHASIDLKNTLLGKHHYLLFWLAVAMQPRMCMLLDQDLEPIKTQVRVGTAVDTVGQVCPR